MHITSNVERTELNAYDVYKEQRFLKVSIHKRN